MNIHTYTPRYKYTYIHLVSIFWSFDISDGFGKWIGYAMWSIIWSKTVPHARHTHSNSHASPLNCQCVPFHHLLEHKNHTNSYAPRPRDLSRSWRICTFLGPKHLLLRTSSMPCEILTIPEHCLPHDVVLWDHSIASHISMLGFGSQNQAWKYRSCLSKLNLLLDKCVVDCALH